LVTHKECNERFLYGLAGGLRLAGLFAYKELLKSKNFWGSKIVLLIRDPQSRPDI
jgi:hypothetical protein